MTAYLTKHSLFPPLIETPSSADLAMVVVIPCYNESELLLSLHSLKEAELPGCAVEIIVVINESELVAEAIKIQNQQCFDEATKWAATNSLPRRQFHILYKKNLPRKHAGVGLARKIGMDEAARRLESSGHPAGVIVCFDADSQCQQNYFTAIEAHFRDHPKTQAAGIHFEHPLEGDAFGAEVYDAILAYELHLRYFIHAQKYAGFPAAVQTIGSSMAVRCNAYQQQGGMNRRKAGEDFYFMHKFTAIDAHSEITGTMVIPSPRISDRVPFGTGKAVHDIIHQQTTHSTYAPEAFRDLKVFFDQIDDLFLLAPDNVGDFLTQLPDAAHHFLIKNNFAERLLEIRKNSVSLESFRKRFFRWFNAFLVMKYVHFARDHFYSNVDLEAAVTWLMQEVYGEGYDSLKASLLFLRGLDRGL